MLPGKAAVGEGRARHSVRAVVVNQNALVGKRAAGRGLPALPAPVCQSQCELLYPARLLPRLARVIPMETKPGQNSGHFARLLPVKLNPDPSANNLRLFKEVRCLTP